jgi:hypothetical protein
MCRQQVNHGSLDRYQGEVRRLDHFLQECEECRRIVKQAVVPSIELESLHRVASGNRAFEDGWIVGLASALAFGTWFPLTWCGEA